MIQLGKIQSMLSKFAVGLTLFCFTFVGSLAMVGFVSNLQTIDGALGLMNKSQKPDYDLAKQIFVKSLTNQTITAEASPATIVAVTPGALDLMLGVLSQKMSIVAAAIVAPISALMDSLFNVIDEILDTLEQIADVLNATRVAMGFLIYRDVEGTEGKGSTNFMGSQDFARQLLGDLSSESSFFNSNFNKKDELIDIVGDGIAWLDFMTVQRSMQNGLIGDFLSNNSKFDVFTGEDIKAQIQDVVLGTNCEDSLILNMVPVFREYKSRINTCEAEYAGDVYSALESRKQSILEAAQAKVEEYNQKPPADCKYGQYFEVEGGEDVKYNDGDRGKFGQIIAKFADKIKLKTISPDECEGIKQANQKKSELAADQLAPANLLFTTASPNGILSFLQTVVNVVVQQLFTKLQERFKRAVTIVTTISKGTGDGLALYGALFNIAFNARAKIVKGINDLNKEFRKTTETEAKKIEEQFKN
jgi:hypothetical protein